MTILRCALLILLLFMIPAATGTSQEKPASRNNKFGVNLRRMFEDLKQEEHGGGRQVVSFARTPQRRRIGTARARN